MVGKPAVEGLVWSRNRPVGAWAFVSAPTITAAKRSGLTVDVDRLAREGDDCLTPAAPDAGRDLLARPARRRGVTFAATVNRVGEDAFAARIASIAQ